MTPAEKQRRLLYGNRPKQDPEEAGSFPQNPSTQSTQASTQASTQSTHQPSTQSTQSTHGSPSIPSTQVSDIEPPGKSRLKDERAQLNLKISWAKL